MDENKKEEFECYYCFKTFSSEFMRREHISYGHKELIKFQTSKIYRDLLKRINKLEEEVNELKRVDKRD